MQRTLRCDFYQIVPARKSSLPLDRVLMGLLSLDSDSRNLDEFGVVFRMDPVVGTKHRIFGDLVRIRMDDLPEKCNRNGKKEPLTLDEDEGLGESNAFMIDSDRSILAIQRNKFGVSPNSLCRFIFEKTNRDGEFQFDPILTGSGLQKLKNLSTIRKMEIRLARVDPKHGLDSNQSISKTVDILNEYGGAYVNLTLSMSHKSGSMDKGKILRAFKEMVSKVDQPSVEKFIISGYNDEDSDGKNEIVDLLADRIGYRALIEVEEGSKKSIPYLKRKRFIEEAFASCGAEIRHVLGS